MRPKDRCRICDAVKNAPAHGGTHWTHDFETSREGFGTKRQPMRSRSDTNSRAVAWREEYLPKRERFLAERPYCEMRVLGVCTRVATEVQHMVQTSLDPSIENLLDEEFWLACCSPCNMWAEAHPQEAIARGVSVRFTDAEAQERRRIIRERGAR